MTCPHPRNSWLPLHHEADFDDEAACSWCGGEGSEECPNWLECLKDHSYGECACSACGGSGFAKDQTLW